MGDVSFETYHGHGFDSTTHEAFCLKVERVKFEHSSRYCLWKNKVSGGYQGIDLLNSPEIAERRAHFE